MHFVGQEHEQLLNFQKYMHRQCTVVLYFKLQAARVAAGRKPAVPAAKFILRVCGCPLIYATPLICFVGVVAEPQDPHDPHAKHT